MDKTTPKQFDAFVAEVRKRICKELGIPEAVLYGHGLRPIAPEDFGIYHHDGEMGDEKKNERTTEIPRGEVGNC